MRTTTIVVADDHHVVRHGLRALLHAEPDFQVTGEASDGLEAAEAVRRLRPDVLVLDMVMPGLNGIEVTRRVGKDSPHTRVVILSMYENEAYVIESLRAGAEGYVLKRSTWEELVEAIREVAAGRRYLSPPFSGPVIEAYLRKAQSAGPDLYEMLTPREREVLHMAAEGRTSTEIADRLCISSRTVENHRANGMHKLGLHTQTELVRYALHRGLLPLEG